MDIYRNRNFYLHIFLVWLFTRKSAGRSLEAPESLNKSTPDAGHVVPSLGNPYRRKLLHEFTKPFIFLI